MITEIVSYGIKCDECGDYFCCQDLNTGEFTTKDAAEYFAELEGWEIKDGKHICPDCYFKINGEEEE